MNPVLWTYLAAADTAAIITTFQAWRTQRPSLGILALASEHEPGAVAALQQAASQTALPLAGAVVPGLIVEGEIKRHGVLLLALDGAPQAIVPLARGGVGTDEAAVAELAAFIDTHAGEEGSDTLLLLIDAMTPDVGSLLDRLYLDVGNRVSYAGANVGSETFKPVPCLFDNTRFVQGAALALILRQHPGAVLAHGYSRTTALCVATGTVGNRIAVINGQPAFEVYRELIAATHGVDLNRENFYQYAVRYPLALHLAEGEPLVRIAVAVDDDGSLHCVGEVPESSLLYVVEAPRPDSLETARAVAAGIRAHAPAAVLAFYCAGRLMHHGEAAAARELCALRDELAPAPQFGALSLGEVANYQGQGYPRFHNATLVALPWC
ncbi:MAG TPA: FIST C-terminal domain-containing protein [Steroidobacteraceae bacterium]|nr:FIST C-terminal domain-containing protein [Steroidobacteraceae bacterium]